MTYILNRSRDPIVSPTRTLSSTSQHEFSNFVGQRWATRFLFTAFAVVPFLSNQLAMPAQDRIGCE